MSGKLILTSCNDTLHSDGPKEEALEGSDIYDLGFRETVIFMITPF